MKLINFTSVMFVRLQIVSDSQSVCIAEYRMPRAPSDLINNSGGTTQDTILRPPIHAAISTGQSICWNLDYRLPFDVSKFHNSAPNCAQIDRAYLMSLRGLRLKKIHFPCVSFAVKHINVVSGICYTHIGSESMDNFESNAKFSSSSLLTSTLPVACQLRPCGLSLRPFLIGRTVSSRT